MITRPAAKALGFVLAPIITILLLWWAMYPDEGDPKNLHYVAWKSHLLPMDPLLALGVMTHDVGSERMVLGKDHAQLVHRFGFVRAKFQVSPYLLDYCAASRPNSEVLFLNNSDYMVVMTKDRATELVLCKG